MPEGTFSYVAADLFVTGNIYVIALRKHAYSNIRKTLPPKKIFFSNKKF